MPTRISGFGLTEVISDDHARSLAAENIDQVEALQRRFDQYGYLSPRDEERMLACFTMAEDLLKQTGDYKDRPMQQRTALVPEVLAATDRHMSNDEPEPQPRKLSKDEARERAQAILSVYKMIGRAVVETKEANTTHVSHSETEQKVNMKLDYDTGMYTITGLGKTVQYADRKTAEAECRRRVGLA